MVAGGEEARASCPLDETMVATNGDQLMNGLTCAISRLSAHTTA